MAYRKSEPRDETTVVLLHGFLSSKAYWKRITPLLVDAGYRIITIDLLGFGSAPKPRQLAYTYEDHLRHIEDSIRPLALNNQMVLIGHSMGALLAARYTVSHPEKVTGLVLVNPPIYKDSDEVRTVLRQTNALYRILLDSKYRHVLWALLRRIGLFSNHNRHSRERSLRNIIEMANLFTDLKSIHIPTLLIVGKKDRKEYLTNLQNVLFGKNIEVLYEDVSHHAPREDPELLFKRIQTFLSNR